MVLDGISVVLKRQKPLARGPRRELLLKPGMMFWYEVGFKGTRGQLKAEDTI